MEQESVRARIREFLLESFMRGASPDALRDDMSFEQTAIVDSARSVEVIVFLEETFGISVDPLDVSRDNLDSVDKLVSFVERKRKDAA